MNLRESSTKTGLTLLAVAATGLAGQAGLIDDVGAVEQAIEGWLPLIAAGAIGLWDTFRGETGA